MSVPWCPLMSGSFSRRVMTCRNRVIHRAKMEFLELGESLLVGIVKHGEPKLVPSRNV